jgi:hypothetical protein
MDVSGFCAGVTVVKIHDAIVKTLTAVGTRFGFESLNILLHLPTFLLGSLSVDVLVFMIARSCGIAFFLFSFFGFNKLVLMDDNTISGSRG